MRGLHKKWKEKTDKVKIIFGFLIIYLHTKKPHSFLERKKMLLALLKIFVFTLIFSDFIANWIDPK